MGLTRLQPGTCCGCAAGNPCSTCTVPLTLNITDSFTTIAVTYNSGSGFYIGCYWLPAGSAPGGKVATACDCADTTAPSGTQTLIYYSIQLVSGSSCQLDVIRNWFVCNDFGFGCYYCQDIASLTTCASSVNPDCFSRCSEASDTGTATLTGCEFPLDMTLGLASYECSFDPPVFLNSPLGADITIEVP
jgi:hypothetical protein